MPKKRMRVSQRSQSARPPTLNWDAMDAFCLGGSQIMSRAPKFGDTEARRLLPPGTPASRSGMAGGAISFAGRRSPTPRRAAAPWEVRPAPAWLAHLSRRDPPRGIARVFSRRARLGLFGMSGQRRQGLAMSALPALEVADQFPRRIVERAVLGFRLDQRPHDLYRHGAGNRAPVDEERGGADHPDRLALGESALDHAPRQRRTHAGIEARGIAARLQGEVAQAAGGIGGRELVLMIEGRLLEGPEVGGVLLDDAGGRLRRGHGPGMNLDQRKIFEDHAHRPRHLLRELLQDGVLFLAIGALEIAEFVDGHRRRSRTLGGAIANLQLGADRAPRVGAELAFILAEHDLALVGRDEIGLLGVLVPLGDGDLDGANAA